MKIKTILYYWAPVALWSALVLGASNPTLSSEHTESWLQNIIRTVRGAPLSEEASDVANFAIRKLGHLTEYGIFSLLAFRAVRRDRSGSSVRWAAAAIAMAAGLAAIDEFHQAFVPGRTGVVTDVLLDVFGATIAQLLSRHL